MGQFIDPGDRKGGDLDADLAGKKLLSGEEIDQRCRVLVTDRVGRFVMMVPVGMGMVVRVTAAGVVMVAAERAAVKRIVTGLAPDEQTQTR